jgi:hypothetical protein
MSIPLKRYAQSQENHHLILVAYLLLGKASEKFLDLYLKLAKMLSFLLLLMFSLQQNWRRGQNRFCLEVRGTWGEGKGSGGRWREMAQTMYAHMNK